MSFLFTALLARLGQLTATACCRPSVKDFSNIRPEMEIDGSGFAHAMFGMCAPALWLPSAAQLLLCADCCGMSRYLDAKSVTPDVRQLLASLPACLLLPVCSSDVVMHAADPEELGKADPGHRRLSLQLASMLVRHAACVL